MSDQPTDPQSAEESLDDLEVPTDEADAVTGGVGAKPADDEPGDETQGQLISI